MKRIFMFLFALAIVLGFYVQGQATLTTIGQAQFGGAGPSYNLIWDNDSPFGSIVWLNYSKDKDIWTQQYIWADYGLNTAGPLSYNINPLYTVTWSGRWRLPTIVPGERVWSYNGTTTAGGNITSSEMGHLYYTELENKTYYDTSENYVGDGNWGLLNKGPFSNLKTYYYWSSELFDPAASRGWCFNFINGIQDHSVEIEHYYALAVRPANVVFTTVPEPGIISLLIISIMSLVGLKRWWRK